MRRVLRALQELTPHQEVDRFRDLWKIVADKQRKLLAGHESVGVPDKEQQEIQITWGPYTEDSKELFEGFQLIYSKEYSFNPLPPLLSMRSGCPEKSESGKTRKRTLLINSTPARISKKEKWRSWGQWRNWGQSELPRVLRTVN